MEKMLKGVIKRAVENYFKNSICVDVIIDKRITGAKFQVIICYPYKNEGCAEWHDYYGFMYNSGEITLYWDEDGKELDEYIHIF